VEEAGGHQFAAVVVRIHEAVGYVEQYGEADGEDHQFARDFLAAELWRLEPRHAA